MDTIYGPMVVILENNTAKCDMLLADIWRNLELGIVVLIRGWTSQDAMEFNVQDIEKYKPPITQAVAWHGKPPFYTAPIDTNT